MLVENIKETESVKKVVATMAIENMPDNKYNYPIDITETPDPFYNETNQSYILKSVQELRSGEGHAHELLEEDADE